MPGADEVEKELEKAEIQMGSMNFKKAVTHYNKVIKLDPKCAAAYFGRAEAQIQIPDATVKDIMTDFKKAISLEPDNAMYYARYGSFCLEYQHNDQFPRPLMMTEAENAYMKAAEKDKENAAMYYFEFASDNWNFHKLNMDDETTQQENDYAAYKSLEFVLKALEMDKEKIISLLNKPPEPPKPAPPLPIGDDE